MNKGLKSIITAAMVMTITGSLLVGCGSDGSSSEGEKVQIEVFSNKSESKDTLQGFIDEFQVENPNIEVTLNVPPEAETVLKTRLTKNDMPDVLSIGGNATYGELVRAGALKDLSDQPEVKEVQTAYLDMIARLVGNGDEKVYGIPYATNANGIIYNKDKFAELNLQVPKTWDELIQTCEEIQSKGEVPFYLTLKDAWTGMIPWNSLASNIVPSAEFTPLRKDNKTTFKESYGEVADKIVKLLKYGENDIYGIGYGDGNAAFAQGESVMYLQGNWALAEILKANPDIKLGMFPFPATNEVKKNNLVSGVDVLFAVPTESKHPKEALKFIEFLTEKENAQKYIEDQFAFSALKDVYQKDEKVVDLQESFESGRITSFADHYYPSGMEVANLLQEYLHKKDKAAFLDKLDTEWDKINKN